MVTAYLRVSTGKQNLQNQKSEIKRYALKKGINIDKWVTETISGKTAQDERKLGKLIKSLKMGDTLIVTEISRLSRTLHEIMAIMGYCLSKKITIYSTKDGYAFDDSINSKVLSFAFGLVAEIERNLISQRTKEALSIKKSQGVILGRKKGFCPKMIILYKQKNQIKKMIEQGMSVASICRRYDLSIETFRAFRKKNNDIDTMIINRFGEKRYNKLVKNSEVLRCKK